MNVETVEQDFREKVGRKVRLAPEGIDRFRVFTPFLFDDGDHLCIVLRREGDGWTLTDEGHTFMHLTYELDERSLREGTRNAIITNVLSGFRVEDTEGELKLRVPGEEFGDALFAFVQALLKVTDVRFLSRERVRSTFMEDFQSLITATVPEARRTFEYHDRVHDPDGKYAVDCLVNGQPKPLLIFAIPNDGKCQYATIALLQFERWHVPHQSIGIFEEQENINRRILARFSDVCEKQFSSLDANRDRITRYICEAAGI